VLVQIVEANGTHQPTHDSGKSDGADGAVVVLLFGHLLLGYVLLVRLLSATSFLRKLSSLLFKDSLYVKSL
jgi:hypothetical protein